MFDSLQRHHKHSAVRPVLRGWPFCFPALPVVQASGPCSSVVEHSLGKGEVGSSILLMGTSLLVRQAGFSTPWCAPAISLIASPPIPGKYRVDVIQPGSAFTDRCALGAGAVCDERFELAGRHLMLKKMISPTHGIGMCQLDSAFFTALGRLICCLGPYATVWCGLPNN